MKILIVSLLRMGDLVMQRHVLDRYLQKHKDVQIHLLTHPENKKLSFLFPEVQKFHFFERAYLQNLVNDPSENIFKPVKVVQNLVEELNSESFDLVLNWTHQRTAAYLMGMIEAKQKSGPIFESGQFFLNGNQYLKKFNDTFSNLKDSIYHYVDYLSLIHDLPTNYSGQTARTASSPYKNVLIQPLSSDSKKNWNLAEWKAFVDAIQSANSKVQIQILGASFEKDLLADYFTENQILICDLQEAYHRIQSADLLMSADTVTKHLASMTQTPVVELSLGSSQPSKTGIWSLNSYIVQPHVACYPCPHSAPCSKSSHLCGESISGKAFAELVLRLMGTTQSASANSNMFKIYKTTTGFNNCWKMNRMDVQGGTDVSRSRELLVAGA